MRFSNNFVSTEIYVMSKKSSWVKKRHSVTARAKAQQRHRRKKGLFKKAAEFCLECESDVFVAVRVRKTGQMYILDSSSQKQWLNILSNLVCLIKGFPIIELTLLGDMLPSSDPGDTGGYHAQAWWVFVRSGRRISFYRTLEGMTWTRALLVDVWLDMRYPPGKLPQPKPNPALGGLGWPHLIPVTQWAG